MKTSAWALRVSPSQKPWWTELYCFTPVKRWQNGSPLKIAQWTTQHRKKSSKLLLHSYWLVIVFPFSSLPMIHFLYNTELFALHRGHPPLLVNQLHSFHVLVSICKTLSRGVKRLLCNKFSIWKMKQDFHISEHYFFQELGKKELF